MVNTLDQLLIQALLCAFASQGELPQGKRGCPGVLHEALFR